MADAARRIDIIDTAPRFVQSDAIALNNRFRGVDTAEMLATLFSEKRLGRTAIVSSFGAESAVLLHLIAQFDPSMPVLLVDTLKLFPETLAYRDALVARLGLTDVRSLQPDAAVLAAKDESGLRWSYDPDGCCAIRKVEPLERALTDFDVSISGARDSSPPRATACRASRSTATG